MAIEVKRRRFLTLAGASVGLLATGAGSAGASSSTPSNRSASPVEKANPGVMVGISGTELEVELDGTGRRVRLAARDFGQWDHQIGDRVIVAQDTTGNQSIRPLVETLNAPLPRGSVDLGSMIEIGGRSARVSSQAAKTAIDQLRAGTSKSSAHWLLIENSRTGELRVFGVMDR